MTQGRQARQPEARGAEAHLDHRDLTILTWRREHKGSSQFGLSPV